MIVAVVTFVYLPHAYIMHFAAGTEQYCYPADDMVSHLLFLQQVKC